MWDRSLYCSNSDSESVTSFLGADEWQLRAPVIRIDLP